MTLEQVAAMINAIGKEKLLSIKFNNNTLECVYGNFDPAVNLADVGGVECFVFFHTAPEKYTDGKGPITTTDYKPLHTLEGFEFIDDVSRMSDVDKWTHSKR